MKNSVNIDPYFEIEAKMVVPIMKVSKVFK